MEVSCFLLLAVSALGLAPVGRPLRATSSSPRMRAAAVLGCESEPILETMNSIENLAKVVLGGYFAPIGYELRKKVPLTEKPSSESAVLAEGSSRETFSTLIGTFEDGYKYREVGEPLPTDGHHLLLALFSHDAKDLEAPDRLVHLAAARDEVEKQHDLPVVAGILFVNQLFDESLLDEHLAKSGIKQVLGDQDLFALHFSHSWYGKYRALQEIKAAEDALAAAKADNEKKDGEIEARDTILAAKDETIKELGTDLAAEKVKLQNIAKLAAATKDPGLRKQLEDILRAGTRNDAG